MARRLIGLLLLTSVPAWAGDADVVGATVDRRSRGVYDFDVTIRSADAGWDRYADRIDVLGPDGRVLQTRVLEHPHETEQPFTRDVLDVHVPAGVETVRIRAHFKPTGYDGAVLEVSVRDK